MICCKALHSEIRLQRNVADGVTVCVLIPDAARL